MRIVAFIERYNNSNDDNSSVYRALILERHQSTMLRSADLIVVIQLNNSIMYVAHMGRPELGNQTTLLKYLYFFSRTAFCGGYQKPRQ